MQRRGCPGTVGSQSRAPRISPRDAAMQRPPRVRFPHHTHGRRSSRSNPSPRQSALIAWTVSDAFGSRSSRARAYWCKYVAPASCSASARVSPPSYSMIAARSSNASRAASVPASTRAPEPLWVATVATLATVEPFRHSLSQLSRLSQRSGLKMTRSNHAMTWLTPRFPEWAVALTAWRTTRPHEPKSRAAMVERFPFGRGRARFGRAVCLMTRGR